MRTTSRKARFVGLLLAGSVAAAACGGDGSDEPKASSAPTDAPKTSDAPKPTDAPATPAPTPTDPATTPAPVVTDPPTADYAMRITFDIADEAVWDDGSPITWKDFACTSDAYVNTPGSISTTGYDQITSVAAGSSDKQVVVDFKTVYAPYKTLFAGIIKADVFENCKDVSTDFADGITFSAREWKLDSWTTEQIVYVPNEAYWGEAPKIDKAIFAPAEDGPTLLKAGTVDFIFPQAYTGIDAELADPNVKFEAVATSSYEALYFQQNEGPFADDVYREAFSKSIDRDALYAQIYAPFAQGVPLLNCGPTANPDYCDNVFAETYDPAAAEKVLTDAGWTKNGEGFWEKDGTVPEVRWMVNTGNVRRENTQAYLIPKLAEAGFKVNADNCEAIPCVFETRLPSLDYDLAMYISTVAPDPAYLTSSFVCDQIPSDANDNKGQNSTGWCNEEASKALHDADTTVDAAARTALIKTALQAMADDHVLLPLLAFPGVGAGRTDKVADTNKNYANYRGLNDFGYWTDVDGDGTIIIGAEQFPASDCPNPITECANSTWFQWLIANPVLPAAWDTTNDQKFAVTNLLTGEPVVEIP